jgi:hypothetical protein
MYYEKLALEVNAAASGLDVVKPAQLKGKSGIDQKFTFVAADGTTMYAFDIYPQVDEKEVLRTYLKKLDTGAETFIICLQGKPTPEAGALARQYGVEVLGPGSVGDFFNKKIIQQLRSLTRATA